MFYTDWRLSIIALLTIPVLLVATAWFKRNIKASFQDVRDKVSSINSFVQEHIVGMNIVQIFNREEAEFDKFKKINADHRDAHLRSIFYYAVFFPVVEVLSAVSIGLVVWYGGEGILSGKDITIGEIIAFILFIHMMFRPIRQLADRFNVLQMGIVGSERVFKIIDTDEKIKDNIKVAHCVTTTTKEFAGEISKLNKNVFINKFAYGYSYVFRGTPLLVQIFIIYFGLGQIEYLRSTFLWVILKEPYWCAIIAFALNTGAYTSEILRSAFQTIKPGIIEAGKSLGITNKVIFYKIQIPIAIRQSLPAYGNEIILMMKGTSLASTVTIMDLTGVAKYIISTTFKPIEVFIVAGGIYLFMTFVIHNAIKFLEKKYSFN